MVRTEGWERRFSEYLKESKNKAFSWGDNDCILFSVKGAEIVTGVDTYSSYLGYMDEQGANAIIQENGGIESLISKHFGHSHKDVFKARRADLVMIKRPYLSIGMVDDSGEFVACVSEIGYARVPLKNAWRVWSYG